jgi:hypothetical protein
MNVRSLPARVRFFSVLLLFALILSLIPATVFADTGPTSFVDEFDAPTLDPAWQVVEFTGTRGYGYISPANHISLTDNPGYLRYYLDPMTHAWGFLNGYQVYNPYYPYDYGLELQRLFSGEHWVFESKANFYLPYTNGRGEDVHIYFGDGGANTFAVIFQRYRDVTPHPNELTINLWEKFGPTFDDRISLEYYMTSGDIYGPPESTYVYRLERNDGVLTASWSTDGANWTQAWSHDMGTQLDGLQQRLVITGLSWFNNAGSYADYDYVRLDSADETPPIIVCDEPDGQWHAEDVSIACTASDDGTGLADPADASFSLSTSVPAGSETADAATESHEVCDVAGNCATAGPITGNMVDKKAPEVTLTAPAAMAYLLNQAVPADYACTDGGSDVASCDGAVAVGANINTASVGTQTFAVNALDNVGNANSQSVQYSVLYGFTGFFSPVDNPPVLNGAKAGQSIPLKWRLLDANGAPVTDLAADSVSVTVAGLACAQGASEDAVEEYAAGASGVQNLGDGYYQFNWKTPTAYARSCKTLKLDIGEGAGYEHLALFQFKK